MAEGNLRARVGVSLLLIAVFVGVGTGAFFKLKSLKVDPERASDSRPRSVVRTERATRGSYRELLRGYGRARALRRADVSAEVSGVVTWTAKALEAGSAVAAGDELVKIDPRDYEQARDSAQARKEQAEAAVLRMESDLANLGRQVEIARRDLEAARRELIRVQGLSADGVLTKSDLDNQEITTRLREKEHLNLETQHAATKQELARAAAEVDAATASLERARLDLERTVVCALFSGRVEDRRVSRGARVAPGTVLFALTDLSRVEVPIALGASHYDEVAVGAAASLRLREGGDAVWEGSVARLSPGVDPADRTFMVYVEVEGKDGRSPVPPGAFVVGEVAGTEHPEVIAVPRGAFVSGRLYVAEPDGDGEAVARERRPTVQRLLPEVALLTEGLAEGELVITTNLEQVADGTRVLLADPGEKSDR